MFAPLLLAACLAPPAGGADQIDRNDAADPWAARVGPRVSITFGGPVLRQPPHEPLIVGVRVEPYVTGKIDVRLFRDTRDPLLPADPGAGPRDHLEQVAGVLTDSRLVLPGDRPRASDDPAPVGGAAVADLMLYPPAGGWPEGSGELVVTLPHTGLPAPRAAKPVFVGEWSAAAAALARIGLLVSPGPPAPDPPPVTTLTLEPFDSDGPEIDLDADPLPVPAGHAVEVRGTFRAVPDESRAAFGPVMTVGATGPIPQPFGDYVLPLRDPGPAGRTPAADGTVLYWFRATLPPTPGPGRWVVHADALHDPNVGHFRPRSILVAPADDGADAGGADEEDADAAPAAE